MGNRLINAQSRLLMQALPYLEGRPWEFKSMLMLGDQWSMVVRHSERQQEVALPLGPGPDLTDPDILEAKLNALA